jgi:predicted transposase YdaD
VVLMAVYLTRGDRASFPDAFTIQGGSLRNQYQFEVIRLWEHAERIRGRELPELAPLLVLCEDKPVEATLRQERELLLSLEVDRPIRAELLAVAMMVGTRFFARELLEAIFQEEMVMLKEASFITEWMEEAAAQAVARAQPEAEARGEAREAQRFLLRQLAARFGELPAPVVARVEQAETTECEEWGLRLLQATTLEELGLLDNGNGAS